jgi:hypothetical protein
VDLLLTYFSPTFVLVFILLLLFIVVLIHQPFIAWGTVD